MPLASPTSSPPSAHCGARRAEELGEGRFELLRDQHERLELLREERRMLLDVLERERRERLEAQKKVNQLMREYLSLEIERELQRLTEEQRLEREGRTHKHRERQRRVRSWSVNPWLAPGISGTSNAFSETYGSSRSYSRSGSRFSRLQRRTMDKPLEKRQALGPHRVIAQGHRNTLRDAEGGQRTCALHSGQLRIARP